MQDKKGRNYFKQLSIKLNPSLIGVTSCRKGTANNMKGTLKLDYLYILLSNVVKQAETTLKYLGKP